MSVVPSNLTQGPATVWYAVFGTSAPADSAVTSAPGSGFTDVGGTQGGVMAEIDNTYTDQVVDQLVDPIGTRLTKRDIMVTTQLAETTLANLATTMNALVTTSVQSGYTTLDLQTTTSATQPQYSTLIIDGWAPTTGTSEVSCRRRIIVWKAVAQTKVTLEYDMQKNGVYAVTWKAFYVSASVSPVHIVDQTT
jgi:hypothetical protein